MQSTTKGVTQVMEAYHNGQMQAPVHTECTTVPPLTCSGCVRWTTLHTHGKGKQGRAPARAHHLSSCSNSERPRTCTLDMYGLVCLSHTAHTQRTGKQGRAPARAHHFSSCLNSERPRTCRSAHSARTSAVVAGCAATAAAAARPPSPLATTAAGPSSANLQGVAMSAKWCQHGVAVDFPENLHGHSSLVRHGAAYTFGAAKVLRWGNPCCAFCTAVGSRSTTPARILIKKVGEGTTVYLQGPELSPCLDRLWNPMVSHRYLGPSSALLELNILHAWAQCICLTI